MASVKFYEVQGINYPSALEEFINLTKQHGAFYRVNNQLYFEDQPVTDQPDFIMGYIVGETDFASDWLAGEDGGIAFIPDINHLYLVMSEGDYYGKIYRYDFDEEAYVLVFGGGSGGGTGDVDSALSSTSTNPVQNKVIKTELDKKDTVVELTQAQYDALTSAEKTNGTTYYITDSTDGTINTMTGATAYAAGEKGLVPKPEIDDRNKALFGDGKYHTIYSSASGSTIIVITSESSLYNRSVSITDGRSTLTGTFDSTGECTFTDVTLYGGVTLTSTDASNNIGRGSGNITYFGTYIFTVTMDFATINLTTTDSALYGQTVEIYRLGNKIGETGFNSSGQATAYVEETGNYTFKAAAAGQHAQAVATVAALHQTYTVPLFLYAVYTFKIDMNDSNPATAVTPYESDYGCDNLNFTSAHMDFTNDTFDYGSWTGDEFFFPKPCVLGFDGEVDYYLNKNDYTKKTDGTASNVDSTSLDGNVMMEFPTVYFKRWTSGNYNYIVISNKKIDNSFHAYAHHDVNGNVLPFIYIAAYEGSLISGKLRSISGQGVMTGYNRSTEASYAQANNQGNGAEEWYTWHKADWDMVRDLFFLITMNLDSSAVLGYGNDNGYNSTPDTSLYQNNGNGRIYTGSCDNKGLFWGTNVNHQSPMKMFGIENFYGNINLACAGWWYDGSNSKVKMTYGQEDGSTVDGFNFNGSNYYSVSGSGISGGNGYITQWGVNQYGFYPIYTSGSDSTYLCDYVWQGSNAYAICGGSSDNGGRVGVSFVNLNYGPGISDWSIGAALTYKGIINI